MVLSKGEEMLEEISGAFEPGAHSDIFRGVDHGIMSSVTLIYEIKNDELIEIEFSETY